MRTRFYQIPFIIFFSLFVLAQATRALAWGRRGHEIVAGVAAKLVAADEPDAGFLAAHAYDLGYYANVPDLVWKKPASYQVEFPNHFMDLEIFERVLKGSTGAYELDRESFDKKYPEIKQQAGRAYWRIGELDRKLASLSGTLARLKKTSAGSERHRLQLEWLTTAGELGHYVGDLSQPLHCTENFDGQLSNQKGLHAFFEDALVDATFPRIEVEADQLARIKWRAYKKTATNKTTLQLIRDLAESSKRDLPYVLKIDRDVGRADVKAAAASYRAEIAYRLAAGAMALAELWRRRLDFASGFKFNDEKFYDFSTDPVYVQPGAAQSR